MAINNELAQQDLPINSELPQEPAPNHEVPQQDSVVNSAQESIFIPSTTPTHETSNAITFNTHSMATRDKLGIVKPNPKYSYVTQV
ncbi:hypothetical protein SLEP1_g52198 [Rubroshorea leprosula]|uniref:Uncharacterized protein n=1 Tax=Rubroshorea leprosula TaxID=152421 RepID=A0AAV5M6C2_9ROSI|nr:hypothetical protein SLEP1_g52198 [Rubroshorea leprosula]